MQTQQLIKALVDLGIDTYFVAPGSRNYELVEAIHSVAGTTSHVHYDERGLAFFALGYAMATKKIAALVVTSGTAVGNLLPAVMEAYHSGINLLLLTADRPAALRSSGANQTCDQRSIFSTFTRKAFDLNLTIPGMYDVVAIAKDIVSSTKRNPGPIQVNCQLKAPVQSIFPQIHSSFENELDEPMDFHNVDIEAFLRDPEALLLVGRTEFAPTQEKVGGVIATECLVVTDLLSQCRGLFANEIALPDLIRRAPSFRRVLHLGGSFINTTLLEFIKKAPLAEYVQISTPSYFFDPMHIVQQHIPECPWRYLNRYLQKGACSTFTFSEQHILSDEQLPLQGQFLKMALSTIPVDVPIFVANSTLIRDLDQVYYPKASAHLIYSNRGLSGSDGTMATFAGFCLGIQRRGVAFLGDIAFLHDATSLPLLQQIPYGADLFIVNNHGGDIFRRLNHSKNSLLLESHYATRHSFDLTQIACAYGLQCTQRKWPQDGEFFDMTSPSVQLWELSFEAVKALATR